MTSIGILCSGGDSPGMNSAVAAVVRRCHLLELTAVGIPNGLAGLAGAECRPLSVSECDPLASRGGCWLGTSRRPPGMTQEELLLRAAEGLRRLNLDGLVVLGGNGSLAALAELAAQLPCVGIPATIDNDLSGSVLSIGFDSACQHGILALDSLRDTAAALPGRVFTLRTLGGDTGHLALAVAYAGFADAVLVPEVEETDDAVIDRARSCLERRGSALVVVGEGSPFAARGDAALESALGVRVRPSVLGHVQRGGPPSALDRTLGRQLGAAAVDLLLAGKSGAVTFDGARPSFMDLREASAKKPLDRARYHAVWDRSEKE